MLEKEVCIIFYELRSNPADDHGVEEVCVGRELANKELEKLLSKFPKYFFYSMNYEIVRE